VRCPKTSPRYWFGNEIPTLAPAPLVLTAIERLQTVLRIEDLKLDSLTPKNAKQHVNQRYSEFVVKACQAHTNLIPNRSTDNHAYLSRLLCHHRRSLVLPSQHS